MTRLQAWRVLFSAVALALTSVDPAGAGPRDPAPIPDEVVEKLVRAPLSRRPATLPQTLERHLDEATLLLQRIESEERGFAGRPEDPALPTTTHMLLGGTLHELQATRAEFQKEFGRIRDRLVALGVTRQRQAWDELLARIEQRFERVLMALADVHGAQTRGERRRGLLKARAELRTLHETPRAARQDPVSPTPVPTLRQQSPRWQPPDANNAPPPQHMSSGPRPRMYAFSGQTLLAAAPPTPTEAQACTYTAADLGQSQDVQLTPEIQALAASLDYAPVKLYQWVSTEIAFEPYYGSLKGATGTLVSRAGNATDQASLLIALLRASNIPARYVKGAVQFANDPRFPRWLGAKTDTGAANILNQGRIPTTRLVDAGGTTVGARFTHVWVEACVPYANYRGTRVDLTGYRWVPLDPSFKDKTYQGGIATAVDFDYAGYMAKRTNTLPHERYAEQVESFVKTQPPNFSNNTLEDVGYVGRIVPRSVDILPASLPYQVVAFNAWGAGLTAETAELPSTHRYTLTISVKNAADSLLAPPLTLSLPETVLQRVTLSFKGATAGDQQTLDAWESGPNLDTPLPCAVNVVPVVKVDGAGRSVGTTAVGLCTTTNRLTLTVALPDSAFAGNPTGTINTITFSNIQAGDYHALFAYAFQTSDRLLTERAAKLLASVRSLPDPNTNLEETEGEFLHLVGLKYIRYISDSFLRIGDLDGGSGESGNHLGLTSSRMKVGYVFDEPFAISRSGFLVDFPGEQSRSVDLATGGLVPKTFRLMGHAASAYESYIWQENARLDAVSTVRGIQFATETGIPLLTITSANAGTGIPKLCTSSTPCAGVASALFYPPSTVTTIQNAVNSGFTVTLPRQLIRYVNWTGAVWIQEKSDATSMQAGFIISGGYAGGYTLGPPVSFDFSPVLDTGFNFDAPLPANTTIPPVVINSGVGGGVTPFTPLSGDPVNLVTGNSYHTERDLVIKGRGLPIVFERSYNSRVPKDGPLGFGWTHSFNHVLIFNDDDADGVAAAADTDGLTSSVSWIDGTGSEKFIRVAGTASGVAPRSVFTPPSGFFFQTARQADGTYTIREKNGLTYTFESVAGTVGQRARLLRITDRNGNTLTLTYGAATGRLASVTDGLGRSLTFTYDVNTRVSAISDWTGRTHQYSYDASGNLIAYNNPLAVAGSQNPVSYTYYSDPQLNHAMRSYTLPRGNGMTFEYYVNGRVFRHVNTLGEASTYTYNDFRRETVTVNERGHTRRFFFDPQGNPVKIIEENGGERAYTYDPANPMNRLTKRDPMGRTTSYAYDANGNVTRITLPSGNTIESSFLNSFNQPGKIKDARGNYAILKYDSRGNLLQTIRLRSGLGATVDPTTYTPAPGDVVAWTINTYDAFGNVLTTKQVRDAATQAGPTLESTYDAQGLNAIGVTRRGGAGTVDATATLTYDALGRVTQGLRPDWYPTQAFYDAVDRVIRGTDQLGQLRDYTYDPNGNLVRESLTVGTTLADDRTATYDLSDRKITQADAGGFITNSQYDAAGNLIALTNPDGYTLRFEYDPANRVISAIDQEGHSVRRTLDLDGQPRTITDPNGSTVTSSYYGPERDGRLKSRTDPLGRVTAFDYDAHGNVISVTDNLGRTTLTSYDELDRPVRVVGPAYPDPTLGTIRPAMLYTYDLLGNPLRVDAGRTDSTGMSDVVTTQMSYQYDDFGRKLTETDPLGRRWAFSYDVQGNPITVSDPRGQVIKATWGFGHQLLSKTDDTGTVTHAGYTRNALGQVTRAQSPAVTYTMTYDAGHRPATVRDSRGGIGLTYRWSPGGQLNNFEDSQGHRTDYAYDPVGRLTGLWAPNGDLVSFLYDAGGRLIQKWFPNGVATQYTWNPDNTLAQVLNLSGDTALVSQHDYTYDGSGNRATSTEQVGVFLTPASRYVYDALNRLVEVRDNTTGNLLEAYTYDVLGNRTSKTDSAGGTLAYVYDAANQLLEVRQGTPTGPLLSGLVYDGAGNMVKKCEDGALTITATDCTGDTVTALTYDALQRLSQAGKSGLVTQTYGYDDQGRRIGKTVGSTVTNWLYNGPDIVSQYGSTWKTPQAVFTHGPQLDDPLIRATSTTAQYYHQDGLGSVVALTNPDGSAAALARYDAWGSTVVRLLTIPLYGYTGREPDETGLIYYRARYYDPTIGRFTQRDPMGLAAGINGYAYVNNSPVNFADPLGLLPRGPELTLLADASQSYFNTTATDAGPWYSGLNLGTRAAGAARLLGGAAEAAAGAGLGLSTGWTGVGAVAGGLVFLHGADVAGAGLSELLTGEPQSTFTSQGLQAAGASSSTAENLDMAVSIGGTLGAGTAATLARSGAAAGGALGAGTLPERAAQIHGALDPIAQAQRTTAVLRTTEGIDIIAGGGRDLTAAQRALLGPRELAAALPGAHAEITALEFAAKLGLTPQSMAVTRSICPACATAIRQSGGTLTSPTTVIFK